MAVPRSDFRPDIQGLRALAVLLVVAFHAGLPLRGGFVGVDVFFVVSGFVIASMLAREIEATGHLSMPRFHGWSLQGCAVWNVLFASSRCEASSTRAAVQTWRRRAVEAEDAAVRLAPGSRSIDLVDLLCPGSECRVTENGVWLYRDGGHLSVDGALALRPALAATIVADAKLR